MDVQAVDDACAPVLAGEIGALVVKLPLPPGCLPTLWNAEQRFREAYLEEFPGYYKTGDAGFIDEDGYVFVMTRTDDVINVAGHRLSTGAMEEVLASHPDVAECAVNRSGGRAEGTAPARIPRAQCGCRALGGGDLRRSRPARAQADRPGSRRSRPPPSCSGYRRRARARSCVGRCRRLPTTKSGGCPRPSTIPQSSTRSPRRCAASVMPETPDMRRA